MAWLSGYTTRKKLTTDNTKVDATLTNFPVLVKLTSVNFDFAKANADGFDIRFTESDGTTLCKYERERHDNANSLAEYWVKVPSVSSSAGTDFYIYYRTTDTADGADPTNVWDASFKAVYHLKDIDTSTVADSTGVNAGNKKAANEPAVATAKIGQGQNFDGTDDVIDCGTNAVLDITAQITLEAWMKTDQTTPNRGMLYKGGANENGKYGLVAYTNGNALLIINDTIGVRGTSNIKDNVWHYIAGTYNKDAGGTDEGKIYVDGVKEADWDSSTAIATTASSLKIGRYYSATYGWEDLIDEIRISNIARSAAWVKASYNSGNDSLLTYGGEETPPPTDTGKFFLMFE